MDSTHQLAINKYIEFKNINKKSSEKTIRNFGIDLYRILSMVNIINLHINLYSSNLKIEPSSDKFKSIYLLEIFSLWSVDGFGLISGVVGYRRYKFSNLIYFWFQYSFYSFLFTLYLYITNRLLLKDVFVSIFPIGLSRRWYFNAYFCMYLFLPFINQGINFVDKIIFRNLIYFYFVFFSMYHIIVVIFLDNKTNFHFLNDGYSPLWLTILYIIGAYFGKFIINHNSNYCNRIWNSIFWLLIYFNSSLISYKIFYTLLKANSNIPNKILMNYLSPTTIIQAISLLIVFSRIRITNKYLQKIIMFFYPLTLNIALIHSRLFRLEITKETFLKWVKKFDKDFLASKLYLLSFVVYIVCGIMDNFRAIIFKILKLRELSQFLEIKIPNIINNIFKENY